ncbi:GPI-alpha-mannosyltransferase III (GPI10/PIG-B) involved in glycosylphosphatidylinositol anchor biosynthesis [Phaffia rhodozyma]|uniref:Mannosyltransferase n=1 Tax=Phaffia rhodozyma TaxID=264483 RepID=A0A0F7SMS3_PHARH|nr:GPI-alpha-mannosyltransferase III (GPI10/PIG-B) involved in glycosylphosphatidylinositol anchor biosynthesis [Phaffia rhodozyma]
MGDWNKNNTLLVFLLALVLVRLPLSIVQRTPFQPDESYQSLEPAHQLAFGYGHLTWEWRPNTKIPGVWWGWMGEGRLRGSLWVAFWAGIYWCLDILGLSEGNALIFFPKLIMAVLASICDSMTYTLASRLFNQSIARTALILSLSSLFYAHALTRPFVNSIETVLMVCALNFWPFPSARPQIQETISNDDPSGKSRPLATGIDFQERKRTRIALSLAAVDFIIRPTNAIFWIFLGGELLVRRWKEGKPKECGRLILESTFIGSIFLILSILLDTAIYPPADDATIPLTIPLLPFITHNLLLPTSHFYGLSSIHYHITQSLPILLFTATPFFLYSLLDVWKGRHGKTPLVLLGLAIWSIGVYSLLGHKEWRFLLPLLPVLHLMTSLKLAPILFRPSPSSSSHESTPESSSSPPKTTLNSRLFFFLTIPQIPLIVYLSCYHGAAQHEVIAHLRSQSQVESVGLLMPCHSTPWMSMLHRQDLEQDSWFLTCEPPLGTSARLHETMESIFYSSPSRYLLLYFPPSPVVSPRTFHTLRRLNPNIKPWPTHLAFFQTLLSAPNGEGDKVREILEERGFEQTWVSGWNGFDWAQDDERRRGGVVIWSRIKPVEDYS